jgi:hypothetical protein
MSIECFGLRVLAHACIIRLNLSIMIVILINENSIQV